MKSSPNLLSQFSAGQFEPWQPPEFEFSAADLTTGSSKEQILAIFGAETTDRPEASALRRHPALFSGGVGQGFAAWQPGEIQAQVSRVRRPEWTFLEFPETEPQRPVEPQPFQFDRLAESDESDEAAAFEQETAQILRQARLQADELILAAQAEADQILSQAQEEIDEQKKVGYQQGWEQGRLELGETLKATHELVAEVELWKTALLAQGETLLVEMLKEIAQKIFGEGLELDPALFQSNLNRILESAHGLGNLNIFLNPRDAKTLDPSWSEYQMLISGDRVKIIPSGKIARGGCFVQGETGVVDGRVETQLSAILKVFDETEPSAE